MFFEDGELLDWGTLEDAPEDAVQLALVDRILDGCAADILILEDPDADGSKRKPRMAHLLRIFARHARKRGVEIVSIARADVHAAWARRGLQRKEAVAAAIGGMLPELAHLVPPARTKWANEADRVNIFDAASLVLYRDATHFEELVP
ncbi:MAG: hypothetical protein M3Q69_00600 [Acidobacteriota bacterium]|nr:hypothetical protein [Acidobacteriota bacterium]